MIPSEDLVALRSRDRHQRAHFVPRRTNEPESMLDAHQVGKHRADRTVDRRRELNRASERLRLDLPPDLMLDHDPGVDLRVLVALLAGHLDAVAGSRLSLLAEDAADVHGGARRE